MTNAANTLAVIGASGLVGSHIVREALARGYTVRGTLRDHTDPTKAPHLMALPGAAERLTLHSAEMANPGDFDAVLQGASGVFIASLIPTYHGPTGKPAREMDDEQGYVEIIMPTVDGCMHILQAAQRQGVGTAVICSSTSSTNPVPPVPIKNEVDHWSDEAEQCAAKKYTSATKTVMEKAAIAFCAGHGIRLSILLPTGLYGPVLLPGHLEGGPHNWLRALIETGTPRHEVTPNDSTSMIHLHDLAGLFLACHEHPAASGRYYGVRESWHWQDLYAELQKILPEMQMPAPISDQAVPPTGFDFTRRDSLGVPVRDIPTLLRETVAFLKGNPFG